MRQYMIICFSCMLFSLTLFAEEVTEEPQQSIIETTEEIVEDEQEITPPTEPIEVEEISPIVQESETTKEQSTLTLSTLIEKIKTAESEDRRELMNQLKVELRAMNKEKRQETMRELKKSFAKDGQGQHRHQNMQQQPFKHQPQYRQLHGGHGQGGGMTMSKNLLTQKSC